MKMLFWFILLILILLSTREYLRIYEVKAHIDAITNQADMSNAEILDLVQHHGFVIFGTFDMYTSYLENEAGLESFWLLAIVGVMFILVWFCK